MRPHCFILTEACSCRLELAYFSGQISKNRLVCINAVALAYYGSCRLPVMAPGFGKYNFVLLREGQRAKFWKWTCYRDKMGRTYWRNQETSQFLIFPFVFPLNQALWRLEWTVRQRTVVLCACAVNALRELSWVSMRLRRLSSMRSRVDRSRAQGKMVECVKALLCIMSFILSQDCLISKWDT